MNAAHSFPVGTSIQHRDFIAQPQILTALIALYEKYKEKWNFCAECTLDDFPRRMTATTHSQGPQDLILGGHLTF